MNKNVLFVILIITSLFFFIGSEEQRIAKSNFLNSTVFFPFLNHLKNIKTRNTLLKDNRKLNHDLIQLSLRNKILEAELGKKAIITEVDYHPSFILAEIIGYGGDMECSTLLIDKGKKDNVYGQEAVISDKCIIGKVMKASNNKSIVLPYHHPSFKLAIMTKKEKVQGILESDASGNSYMVFLELRDEISIGDTIVTSHLSTIFPKGYPVGKVTKILTTQSKVHKKALIQRFVEPERVNQVAIIIKEKKVDEERND